jgi:hypothetical protein
MTADPLQSREMVEVISFCKEKKLDLVVGLMLTPIMSWGSSDVNPRGRDLLEHMGTMDLELLNQGDQPTILTERLHEAIVLILCSNKLARYVCRWRVLPELSL